MTQQAELVDVTADIALPRAKDGPPHRGRAAGACGLLVATAAVLALGASAPRAAEPRNVAYVDAHSHMSADLPTDEEIAGFLKGGIAGVVIMWPHAEEVAALAKKYPGYVVPWISLASREISVVTDDTGAEFIRARDQLGICGFGELATRLVPKPTQTDAEAVADPRRMKIYDAAEAKGTPVAFHVSLSNPETLAAIEHIISTYPHTPFNLAHAGVDLEPEALGRLITAHPNVYFDLSARLTRPRPGNPQTFPPALTADGSFQPAWRALIERYPDRFMFAMDVFTIQAVQNIPQRLAEARAAFAPLPLATEEAFAHGNIERLLKGCGGLKVH